MAQAGLAFRTLESHQLGPETLKRKPEDQVDVSLLDLGINQLRDMDKFKVRALEKCCELIVGTTRQDGLHPKRLQGGKGLGRTSISLVLRSTTCSRGPLSRARWPNQCQIMIKSC